MKLAWLLSRAALEAAIGAAARGGRAPDERYGQPSGAGYLLLAAGIAFSIAFAPGLLIALVLAGSASGPP